MTSAGRIFFAITFFCLFIGFQIVALSSFRNFFLRNNFRFDKKVIPGILIFFNVPYLIFLIVGMKLSSLPEFIYYIYVIPFFIYQTGTFISGLVISLYWLIKSPFLFIGFLLKKFKPLNARLKKFKSKKEVVKFDNSRRKFIAGTGFFIAGYAFMGTGVGLLGKNKFEITYRNIYPEALPDGLDGFTMTLISDIHCGPFMSDETLSDYVRAINSLNSDIICIPGDITTSEENEVFPFIKSFSALKAKHGVYATLGNHDYFSKPDNIAKRISENTDIVMLRNDSRIIYVNNIPLIISGTEDTRASGAGVGKEIEKYLSDTFIGAKNLSESKGVDFSKTKKILLYHKPYVFPELVDKGYNLMLSGHTHGGQVVFAKIGDTSVSFASSLNKYVQGLFTEKNFNMYVSRGIGTVGLPIRVNCPPEITQLTFRKKY